MFHHRQPTSTENTIGSCHPFSIDIDDGKVILVHNGIIYNDDEMLAEHQKLGITYSSMQKDHKFNDSECLAIDFARYINGDQKGLKSRGWIAFMALQVNKKNELTKVYFGKNDRAELNFLYSKDSLTIGSEVVGAKAEDDMLYELDYKTQNLTKKTFAIPTYSSSVSTFVKDEDGCWHGSAYEDNYYNEYFEKTYGSKSDYNGDGIPAMSDHELAEYICELEIEVDALEKGNEYANKEQDITDIYRDLCYAYDEQDNRVRESEKQLKLEEKYN